MSRPQTKRSKGKAVASMPKAAPKKKITEQAGGGNKETHCTVCDCKKFNRITVTLCKCGHHIEDHENTHV